MINSVITLNFLLLLFTLTMLFLPFLGICLGVLGRTWDFFPITKVSGESACPVEGASAAAFVLGVLGYAC